MAKSIRFGTYLREISIRQKEVSYNDLAPEIEKDAYGNDLPYRPPRLELRGIDIYRLVKPYISVRLMDQIKAVIPLAVYLFLFQLLILRQNVVESWAISAGLLSVIIGLMPFGETIGHILPSKSPLPVVLAITFLLGIGVTFAEPAIGALQQAGAIVDVNNAPYLYALLNEWATPLVLVVG